MFGKRLLTANAVVFLGLAGCANQYVITDNVVLYPANASAQSWGVVEFYSQYQNDVMPSAIWITLPKGQVMKGQMTFIEDSGATETSNSIWDKVSVGVGVGHQIGSHSLIGMGVGSPARGYYRSDKQAVSINAFGESIGMNCQGGFNSRQKTGTLDCQFTNGMTYKGTIRRLFTASP